MKIFELGEFGLIQRLTDLAGPSPGGELWAGDDAAVLPPQGQSLLVTTDMMVEGVHFDLSLTGPADLGYKALAINISDIAAMGGSGWRGVVALGLRPQLETDWVETLYSGMLRCAGEFDVEVVGGDICRSDCLTISVALIGLAHDGEIRRSGAAPGDVIGVTGTLGASAAGYRLLRAGNRSHEELIAAHLRPRPRVREAEALRLHEPSAMIDISDGLAADLGHICQSSSVGVVVEGASLPLADLSGLGVDRGALQLALGGGEDYELCFTMAPQRFDAAAQAVAAATGTPVTRIGEVVEESRGRVLLIQGDEEPLVAPGWDHLRV